ncbi:MAG: MgtC/SapB family protein [Planctomycetaceae bacterium]
MDFGFLNHVPDLIIRPLVACLIGAMIGWNRERRGRAAGLRTQVLVCLGACVYTMVTMELQRVMRRDDPDSNVDPIRVIAGIVGGIGFLGAGSIIQSGGTVKGVTTAATVWVVGAMGIACGLGLFAMTAVTAALTAITLVGLHWLESAVTDDDSS